MDTTLVVMAAGMGSRYGGLKQMEPVGPGGEFLMDFSAYDAKKAGFSKVVFIIKEEMEKDFNEIVGKRVSKYISTDYVFQPMNVPDGRKKPWGTGHAVLCCRDKVKTPFAIINADDYYGKHAFTEINAFLNETSENHFAMVAYELGRTTTENGTVTRGVCQTENGFLKSIRETRGIKGYEYCEDGETVHTLPKDSVVSMNLWGFTTNIFSFLDREFTAFKQNKDILKDEYLVPNVIDILIKNGEADVRVLHSPDRWYGMTYREDRETVSAAMNDLIAKGLYEGIS